MRTEYGLLVLALFAAACNPPLDVDQPSPTADPLAEAGTGSTYLVGSTVTLDATASFDPDSTIERLTWAVFAAPPDSTSTIADPQAATTTFTLDKVGRYDFMLSVFDDQSRHDTSHVAFVAVPPAITVDAGADVTTTWKTPVNLSGSVQVEANVPATYTWTVAARPPKSIAGIANATTLNATFVPDAEGTFILRLTATTAYGYASDDMMITATVPREVLPYVAVDAEWSAPLQKMIIVSSNPPRLHIHDPASQTDVSVVLDNVPVAVSLRPDGLRAAVVLTSGVDIVDLQTATKVGTTTGPANPFDIVYGADNRVHVTVTGMFVYVYTIDLGTGTMSTQSGGASGGQFFGGMNARLHPNGRTMYTGDTCCSPERMYRFDVSTTPVSYVRVWPYFGQYYSGPLWFTNDGTTIMTRTGGLFRASDDSTLDMTYVGTLGYAAYGWVADSTLAHQLAAAVHDEMNQAQVDQVRFYDDQTFALVKTIPIPDTPYSGTYYRTDGFLTGWRTDASKVYVLGGVYSQSTLLEDVIYEIAP